MSANPYAPPQARVADVLESSGEAEAIRREHIRHEASIRSIGILYYLGAVGLSLAVVGLNLAKQTRAAENVAAIGICAVFGVLLLVAGWGIRKLRPWARVTCIVLSFLGLFNFPSGTLIDGYILYLLFSKKGRRIFASDYPDIVAATPDVKYRTSMVTWIALGLVLVLIAGFVATLVMR